MVQNQFSPSSSKFPFYSFYGQRRQSRKPELACSPWAECILHKERGSLGRVRPPKGAILILASRFVILPANPQKQESLEHRRLMPVRYPRNANSETQGSSPQTALGWSGTRLFTFRAQTQLFHDFCKHKPHKDKGLNAPPEEGVICMAPPLNSCLCVGVRGTLGLGCLLGDGVKPPRGLQAPLTSRKWPGRVGVNGRTASTST